MNGSVARSHALGNNSPIVTRIGNAKGIREEGPREEGAIVHAAAVARRGQCAPVRVAEEFRSTTVVIDRRVLVRDCLIRCLKDNKRNDVIRSFSTVEEWLKKCPHAGPGAVIVLCTAERTEAEVDRDVALLSQAAADDSIIILSDREDAVSVLAALDKGARGYITTSMAFDVVVQAIGLVRAGGTFVPACSLIASRDSIGKLPLASEKPPGGLFTAKQMTVVESLRQGKPNKIIAYELNLCESTVKVHVRNIMKKLRAKNRTEVAFLMNGNGDKPSQGVFLKSQNTSVFEAAMPNTP
jgi:DNA-binding NarL/FixJ family response regulator